MSVPLRRTGVALLALALVLSVIASMPPAASAEEDPTATLPERLGLDGQDLLAARDRTRLTALQAVAEPWPADARPGALLVTTAPGTLATVRAAAVAGDLGDRLPALPFRTATALDDRVLLLEVEAGTEGVAAAALRTRDDVVAVEPDRIRTLSAVPNDPAYPAQFAHQLSDAEAGWDIRTTADAVRVAVLDSGVVADHPDLAGVVVDQVEARTGEIVPAASTDNDVCQVGHGTWVAGIIGALGNNAVDIAGVSWGGTQIIDVNVSAPDEEICRQGGISDSALVAGIDYAVAQGADIVNMSLGGSQRACPTALQTAADAARGAGVTLIAASGNAGSGDIGVPASCNGVISVSGVGPTGEPSSFASTNRFVDLTAAAGDDLDGDGELTPAEGVLTTSWWEFGERTDSVLPVQGTSFSAPYVTGVAALVTAQNPALTPDEVEAVLEGTAEDLGEPGRDDDNGLGLVQVDDALALVASGGPIPPLAPDPAFPVGSAVGVRLGGDVDVQRVSAGTGVTEPITQAVAVSQALFPDPPEGEGAAPYAVLARSDDFADALAGSPITLASAPLLFTGSQGGLAPETAAELQRVLAPGAPVLVLGGSVAIPAQVDADLQGLGFVSERLAGVVREETAVRIAEALTALNAEIGYTAPSAVLASSYVWYDAITAGSLAAGSGSPILLTGPDELNPFTAAALEALAPQQLYVVGGEVRVEAATREDAARAAQVPEAIVLAGPTRDTTAIAVAAEIERLVDEIGLAVQAAVTLNLTRDDGYAHGLSVAPFLGAVPSVFVPVLGEDGSEYSTATVDYFRGFGIDAIIPGDVDLVSEQSAAELEALLETIPEEQPAG